MQLLIISTYISGPSEAGQLGRPGPPHFSCQIFFWGGPRGLAPHVERGVVLLRAHTCSRALIRARAGRGS